LKWCFYKSKITELKIKGYVNIPVNSIESSQPVEKWYCLEMPLTDNDNLKSTTNGITMDPVSTSSNSSSTAISNSASIGSLTTTQNFSKDSITIRIKAKYQCVDILPLQCYSSLIEVCYFQSFNLNNLKLIFIN
jgi:hypothetical protein